MPSSAERPPCPWVFNENESTSDTARFHCECPAQICAVWWLPGAPATCLQSPALENTIFAKLLCVALRACIPIYTQQLVAAILSGFRMIPSGKRKSMGANVELDIGRSWKIYSYMKLGIGPTTAFGRQIGAGNAFS